MLLPNTDIEFSPASARDILRDDELHVPGSLHFRYRKFCMDYGAAKNIGKITYHYASKEAPALQLNFCYTGKCYCRSKNCASCRQQHYHACNNSVDTCYSFAFGFSPLFLTQFTVKQEDTLRNNLLSQSYKAPYSKDFYIDERKKYLLNKLKDTSYCSALQNVTFNAIVQELLMSSLKELDDNKEEIFACRFLADTSAKEKMFEAKRILLQHIGESISIKELSKKVAINECYLKKGFKEVFGITVYDFFLQQKMEHAKYLLNEEKRTVTDVAATLGYSSISHFSSAFKKQTGLKPCELLK